MFGDSSKPTLVMTHGYASFALSHFYHFKTLAEHFRVIIFDNCSWGGNTRLDETEGLDSPENAELVILSWLEGFFAQIDHLLPPKYYLYGHSNGGAQMGLYASFHPERVEKLFLNSPSGFMGIQPPELYDVYAIRTSDEVNAPPSREQVDKSIQQRENSVNIFAHMPSIPTEVRAEKFLNGARDQYNGFSDAVHRAIGAYKELAFRQVGVLEPVYRRIYKYMF